MEALIKKYNAAKEAAHPDKILIAGLIAASSVPAIVPLQIFLTYLTHETSKDISPEGIQILAVAIIGLANAISIAVETKALEKKQYSASPMSTILKVFIGNSLGISSAGHMINFVQIYLANPVHLLNFLTLQAGGGNRLFVENAIGVTLSLSLWKLIFNGLILLIDIDKLKEPAKKISNKLKTKKQQATIMYEIDLIQ